MIIGMARLKKVDNLLMWGREITPGPFPINE